MSEQRDVVIVGGGLVGGLMACRLAEAGRKVVILEAGPEEPRSQQLARYYTSRIKSPSTPYGDFPQAPRSSLLNLGAYRRDRGPDLFTAANERQLGGTIHHWAGLTPRLQPRDLATAQHYGVGVDWPLTYDDLEPWYADAERELGVAGDAERADHPRNGPYPKRAMPMSYADRLVARHVAGSSFRGQPVEVIPLPQARDPDICRGSGSCVQICPTGARYNAMTHIRKARKLGVEVRTESVVHRLVPGGDGAIREVVYRRWDGSDHRVRAKTVILAAYTVESTKLLLLSPGVAASSGLVGRHLMDHTLMLFRMTLPEPTYPLRGPQHTGRIAAFCDGDFRRDHAAFQITLAHYGDMEMDGHPYLAAQEAIRAGRTGKELRAEIRRRTLNALSFFAETEALPDPENRIELSDERDALGIPCPEVHYRVSNYEKRGRKAATDFAKWMTGRLGGKDFRLNQPLWAGSHSAGTMRMGRDPRQSVVDPNLKAHDHSNLYIVGGAAFPTIGTANPSLTVAALALRAAAAIAAE